MSDAFIRLKSSTQDGKDFLTISHVVPDPQYKEISQSICIPITLLPKLLEELFTFVMLNAVSAAPEKGCK